MVPPPPGLREDAVREEATSPGAASRRPLGGRECDAYRARDLAVKQASRPFPTAPRESAQFGLLPANHCMPDPAHARFGPRPEVVWPGSRNRAAERLLFLHESRVQPGDDVFG